MTQTCHHRVLPDQLHGQTVRSSPHELAAPGSSLNLCRPEPLISKMQLTHLCVVEAKGLASRNPSGQSLGPNVRDHADSVSGALGEGPRTTRQKGCGIAEGGAWSAGSG